MGGSRTLRVLAAAAVSLGCRVACAQPMGGPLLPTQDVSRGVPAPGAEARGSQEPGRGRPGSQEDRALVGGPAKPAPLPQAASSGSTRSWIAQTGLSLAAVVALALFGGWVVRSLAKRGGGLRSTLGAGGRAPPGILEVLGRYPVSRGATLVLLKLDRRVLLLAQTAGGRLGGGGFSTLAEITDPEEVASILVKVRDADGDSLAQRFHSMLSRFDGEMPADSDGGLTGRRVQASSAGDRAEVWDTARGSIPVVDLTRQPGPGEMGTGGAAGSLRRRLAALRKHAGEEVP